MLFKNSGSWNYEVVQQWDEVGGQGYINMEILIGDSAVTKCLGHRLVTRPATDKIRDHFWKETFKDLVLGSLSGTAYTQSICIFI
jgi:hypothetical protein